MLTMHQAGDDCLRRVAATVRVALERHPDDLIARYGGEEIIALLIDRAPGDRAARRRGSELSYASARSVEPGPGKRETSEPLRSFRRSTDHSTPW
jgi:GGDEF domain-containing protein